MQIKSPSEYVIANVDIKQGDIITILNEGEYVAVPQDPDRQVLTFQVLLPNGEKKKLSMNNTSQRGCLVAWGDNSKDWVEKQCTVEIARQKVFQNMKDVIYLTPVGGGVSEEDAQEPEEEVEAPEAE